MTWRYQITREKMKDGEEWYAIREVYLNDKGEPTSWTEYDEVTVSSDTQDGVIHVLEMMLDDAKKFPVLDITEEPAK